MEITYITSFWYGVGHHARFSGYQRLVNHIRFPKRVLVRARRNQTARTKSSLVSGFSYKFFYRKLMNFLKSHRFLPTGYYLSENPRLELASLSSGTDVIHHLYGEGSYLLSTFLKRAFDKKICATFHQPPSVFQHGMPIYWREVLNSLDHIFVVSRTQRSFLLKSLGQEHAVSFIPHGVEFDVFHRSSYKKKNCLMVGRWLRDFDLSLEVMKKFERERVKVMFDVVLPKGTPKDIMAKMKNAQLSNANIHYDIEDHFLLRLYSQSYMFWMPLTDFTASNALLEALASGLPIIITDVGGARDYVDEKCGILVEKSDSDGVAEAIRYLLQDEDVCKAMGRSSRMKARSLSWKRIARDYEKVYESL